MRHLIEHPAHIQASMILTLKITENVNLYDFYIVRLYFVFSHLFTDLNGSIKVISK